MSTILTLPGPLAAYLLRLTLALSFIFATAGAASVAAARLSAAVRHRIWSLAVLLSLALPLALVITPEKRLGWLATAQPDARAVPTDSTIASIPVEPIAPDPIPSLSPPLAAQHLAHHPKAAVFTALPSPAAWLLLGWSIPTLLLVARMLWAVFTARKLVRSAIPLDPSTIDLVPSSAIGNRNCKSIPLFESPSLHTPLCVGCLRPAILLPADWRTWPAEQLRAVLTHESAHVARHDVLWQTLARIACALYWLHPLVWLAAHRMRVERELACDDCVLRTGQSPTLYARLLLALACKLKAARAFDQFAVAMATGNALHSRVRAALNADLARNPISNRFSTVSLILALTLLFLAATFSPLKAREASGTAPAAAASRYGTAVLLVTEGNPYLEPAIATSNPTSLTVLTPARYEQTHPQTFDIVVFDRYSPHWTPDAGNLVYVGSVPAPSTPAAQIAQVRDENGNPITLDGQKVQNWAHDPPLFKDVSLSRLWIESALKLQVAPDVRTLVTGTKGPLIVLAHDPNRTEVVIAFDVTESNWPLDLSFPMFWHRLIEFLAPPDNAAPPPATQPTAGASSDADGSLIRFLAGRVVDSSGRPVPAVRVALAPTPPFPATHTATTDADGRFVMYIEPRRQAVRLTLSAQSGDGSLQANVALTVRRPISQASYDNIQITLKPAVQYPVTVTDAADHPIAGATVIAAYAQSGRAQTTTDGAGKATLRLAADTPPASILALKSDVGFDYAIFRARPAANPLGSSSPSTDPAHPLRLTLNGVRTVTVRVTDSQARPLAGVKVSPRTISKPDRVPLMVSASAIDYPETDSNGLAKIALPADIDRPVLFVATFPGYTSANSNSPWNPDTPDNTLTLVLKPLARYHLVVLDPDGKPAPNADVMMVDDRGAQNYGIFSSGRVGPAGTVDGFLNPDTFYMFAAMKDHLASDPVLQVVRAGGPLINIELKLKPAVRVHGRLTAGDPPAPVANGSLYIQFDDAEAYQSLPPEQRLPANLTGPREPHPAVMFNRPTDAHGNFELYLAPGAYHLIDRSNPEGLLLPKSGTFVVPPNTPDAEFNFHYRQRPASAPTRPTP